MPPPTSRVLPYQQPLDSGYQPPAFGLGLQYTGSEPVSPLVSHEVEIKLHGAMPVVMGSPHRTGGEGGGSGGGEG